MVLDFFFKGGIHQYILGLLGGLQLHLEVSYAGLAEQMAAAKMDPGAFPGYAAPC